MQKTVDAARAEGGAAHGPAVAQRHGRRPEDGLARAGHRRDPGRPHPRRRAGRDPGGQRRRAHAGDQPRQPRQVPRRDGLRRAGRAARRRALPAAAGVLESARVRPGDGRADRAGPRALRGPARRDPRHHRRPAVPARRLQRQLEPADSRRAARCARCKVRRSPSRRASGGARRRCRARRSRARR
jgi:hypothetical protein